MTGARPLRRGFPRGWPCAAVALLALSSIGLSRAASPPRLSPGILAALGAAEVGGHKFPPPSKVFHLSAQAQSRRWIGLDWRIRSGYYLYRSRIHVRAPAGTKLGPLQLPPGLVKVDPYFGREQIYRQQVHARVAVLAIPSAGGRRVTLMVTYQGCADAGLCYPPITKTIRVDLPPTGGGRPLSAAHAGPGPAASARISARTAERTAPGTPQGRFAGLARSGSWLAMLGWFYLAGLALAFTPCCLPMLPIVSGIIVGQGRQATAGRAFVLSLTYVLGMAATYTLAGAAAAAAGAEVQAFFQRPWILASFAALLAAMGLAMIGLFNVQMPSAVQTRLAALSSRQSAGTLGGVLVMGALSALIVTSCVGPALVGALAVIGRTGEAARGAAALFALSIGMGTPLLAVGASAGRLLPKAGPWMDTVKRLFGAMMLGVAVWMLARLLPARIALALWAVPALAAAWALVSDARQTRPSGRWMLRLGGALAGVYALAVLAGAALGGASPLEPFPALARPTRALHFTAIRSVADLDRDVARAQRLHRTVMVDFYASWCTSCKEMEATTFADPAVRRALSRTMLLRADVTANDADDRALLRHFGIFGPPTVAFYNDEGRELRHYQVVGYMDADEFLRQLHAAFGSQPVS